MTDPRPIGDIIAPILRSAIECCALFEGLIFLLSVEPDDASRKAEIMRWFEDQNISGDDAALLITALQLEDA